TRASSRNAGSMSRYARCWSACIATAYSIEPSSSASPSRMSPDRSMPGPSIRSELIQSRGTTGPQPQLRRLGAPGFAVTPAEKATDVPGVGPPQLAAAAMQIVRSESRFAPAERDGEGRERVGEPEHARPRLQPLTGEDVREASGRERRGQAQRGVAP